MNEKPDFIPDYSPYFYLEENSYGNWIVWGYHKDNWDLIGCQSTHRFAISLGERWKKKLVK